MSFEFSRFIDLIFLFHRNIFTGLILDNYGYFMLEIFFIICLELALLAAAFLYIYNSAKKGTLNDSPAVRAAKLAELEGQNNSTIGALADSPGDAEEDKAKDPRI